MTTTVPDGNGGTCEERRAARLDAEMIKRLDEHMRRNATLYDRREGWHAGKEVPLALIATLILQTIGIIWGAAIAWGQIQTNKDLINRARVDQAVVDARQERDSALAETRIMQQLDKQDRKLDTLILDSVRSARYDAERAKPRLQ